MAECINVIKAQDIRDFADGELGIIQKSFGGIEAQFVFVCNGGEPQMLFE